MRTINTLDELKIPEDYKKCISEYLHNLSAVPFVSRVILFGSCARETVNKNSDIDLFIASNREITDDEEMVLDWECRPCQDENPIPLDVVVQSEKFLEQFSTTLGMLQKYVVMHGVDLSGLLHKRM